MGMVAYIPVAKPLNKANKVVRVIRVRVVPTA